jgi:hypothetical protein
MADIKIVGGKGLGREECEDKHDHKDCDCHVDHVTLAGKGTKHHPFKAIALPGAQAFNTSVTILYARPNGSDEHGHGTLDKPYATLQRAIRDVPLIIPVLERYYVDITGCNELLPPDYALPPIKSASYYTVLGADPVYGERRFANGLVILSQVAPFSGIPLADTTIAPGDVVSMALDPVSGLQTIVVNKLYPVGVLRGALLTALAPQRRGTTIFDQLDNTPLPGQTTLVTTTTTTNLAFAAPFLIAEPGATLTAQNGDEAFTGLGIKHVDAISLQGIRFRNADPGVNSYALCIVDSNVVTTALCDIEGMYIGPNTQYFFPNGSTIRNKTVESEGQTELDFSGCSLIDLATFYTYDVNVIAFTACGLLRCAAIGPRPAVIFTPTFTTIGSGIATKTLVANCDIQDSVADTDFGTPGFGILSIGPLANVANTKINGCAADAIYINGGNAVIQGVAGSGNGGVGILADMGAQVSIDAATTVQGALVTDGVKAGSLAAVAYAALVPGVAQQYDLQPADINTVATGARIFRV